MEVRQNRVCSTRSLTPSKIALYLKIRRKEHDRKLDVCPITQGKATINENIAYNKNAWT
ncbi:hypothetical protein [Metabacillus idriensis]|uniref:hypothetical protein n=1 Tax=Metabacillus idriensis TaxID=324768 RepID=UPI001478324B|nr:hypothetical protein [Metabacillus idriensis]